MGRTDATGSAAGGRLVYLGAFAFAALGTMACGDDSSSSPPTAPSPTTTSIAVTVAGPLRMGQTTQATGTQMLSNGQSQAITSGWQSDAPSVATVTGAGVVTGVANGRATIYVISGGVQGQQVVRVVPDYHGNWTLGIRVTSCTETGIFSDFDFCEDFAGGEMYGMFLNLSQSGEQVTATPDWGEGVGTGTSGLASVREDGSLAFDSTANVTESGITLAIDSSFALNSTRVGELTGSITDVWRFPNISGEGRLTFGVASATRSGAGTNTMSSTKASGLRTITAARKRTR